MGTGEVEELRKQLQWLQRPHSVLLKSLPVPSKPPISQSPTRDQIGPKNTISADSSTIDNSDDDGESWFIQDELPAQSFDQEHLREHLRNYPWTKHGREILAPVIRDLARLLRQPSLFTTSPPGLAEDRSDYSQFQVYDVGLDGAANLIETSGVINMSNATRI